MRLMTLKSSMLSVNRKSVNNLKQGNEFFSNLKDQKNQAVVQSLQQKGFYTVAVKNPQGQQVPKVVSNKGEILVGMKDGVEYVLRFGEIYRGLEDDENSTGTSRYIYAFARVNKNLLDAPELEPVPAPLANPSTKPTQKKNKRTKVQKVTLAKRESRQFSKYYTSRPSSKFRT